MKILPISNTFNIQKNIPTFNAKAPDRPSNYITTDSYVDETGLHFVRSSFALPWDEENDDFFEQPQRRTSEEIKKQAFLTQKQSDIEDLYHNPYILKEKKELQKALYDLDLERVNRYITNLEDSERWKIVTQPFFALGLADIPLTEQNRELYQNILDYNIKQTFGPVNVIDENGITLLEKVMNAENEPYLDTIKTICKCKEDSEYSSGISYEPMQKYAFDNIQNPEFKEQCKNLPIKFNDIIEDIKSRDLISLDKHIHEQMKCGFCDLEYAFVKCLYTPGMQISSQYTKIIFDIAKKHFPKEIDTYIKGLNRRGIYL